MMILNYRSATRLVAATLLAGLALTTVSRGQGGTSNMPQQQPAPGATKPSGEGGQQPATPAAPPVNPKEQADYKALFNTPDSMPDVKIQLGTAFINNYPMSNYKESVYNQLLHAYYSKQNWDDFYSTGDKVIALDPDDVDALTMVGWVIPHVFHATDPDAQLKLAKAETYEKHAIDVLGTMPKPASITDDQFAAMKAEAMEQAHSGLGLVYFREQKPADAVTQLQAATSSTMPDPADLYVLGIELMAVNRAGDASAAFQKCSTIQSGLSDQCKQRGDEAKKQAASAPH